jgi:hypothetical protein
MIKTAEDRLRFLVRFSELDVKGASAWPALRADVNAFLHGEGTLTAHGGILVHATTPPVALEYPEDELRALQMETRAFLEQLMDSWRPAVASGRDEAQVDPLPASVIASARLDEVHVAVLPVSYGRRPMLAPYYRGSVRSCFLLKLQHLLAYSGTRMPIWRCEDSACGQLFIRVRKQRHCCIRHQRRAYMREYRRGESAKARLSERNHRQYANRLRRSGIPAKPTRRQKKERAK